MLEDITRENGIITPSNSSVVDSSENYVTGNVNYKYILYVGID